MGLSRDLKRARIAYQKGDVTASIAAHTTVAPEEHRHEHGQYIKSAVYGGLDGIITTFAVVAGVAGAALSSGIVLILGFANLIADGLSMAIGDYLSTKAELEYEHAERQRELWEVEHFPEGEKTELIEVYVEKGVPPEDARTIVDIISRHKEAWVDIMMTEELGIVPTDASPVKNAVVTFVSFAGFGLVPLLAYVVARLVPGVTFNTFGVACISTAATLFLLGALKVKVTERNWIFSGLETLLVGGTAALAAYMVGVLLRGL
ncbi:MAG TPA: hypothetical protein EYP14_19920, partial [Planctomycetaceae bacterium]|nr:hypothetical protein [Planctomycetaceae bacterium]